MAAPQGNQSSPSSEKQPWPHTCCQPGFTTHSNRFSEVRATSGHSSHQPHHNTVINTDIYAAVRMDYHSGPRRINSIITSTKGGGYVPAACLLAKNGKVMNWFQFLMTFSWNFGNGPKSSSLNFGDVPISVGKLTIDLPLSELLC